MAKIQKHQISNSIKLEENKYRRNDLFCFIICKTSFNVGINMKINYRLLQYKNENYLRHSIYYQ